MKLALIQTNAYGVEEYRQARENIREMIAEACAQPVDMLLLCECSYPAYFLGLDEVSFKLAIDTLEDFLNEIAGLAKQYEVYIVVGVPLVDDGKLYNAAVVFNRVGERIGSSYKSNLWHFDKQWFAQGNKTLLIETEFGKIGVVICADCRIPELARMLRLQGAKMLLDLVGLVAWAPTPEKLTNQQYEFILPERARENGLYIAVCGKVGTEEKLVTFLGRSMVVSPQGERIYSCCSTGPEIGRVEICLDDDLPLPLSTRRPELYEVLAQPTAQLPVTLAMQQTYQLSKIEYYTSVVRFSATQEYWRQASRYIRSCQLMNSRLIILPEITHELMTDYQLLELASTIAPETVVVLAGREKTDLDISKTAVVLTSKKIVGRIIKTHLQDGEQLVAGNEIGVVQALEGLCLGAVFSREIDLPEIARVQMLKGADVIVWYDDKNERWCESQMQTRATENKIFVVRCSSLLQDNSCVINPEGKLVATTFIIEEQVSSTMVNTALSKAKDIVPGTNIVTSRIPEMYRQLTV